MRRLQSVLARWGTSPLCCGSEVQKGTLPSLRVGQELRMKNVSEALDRSTELLTVERLETAYKTALASAESLEEVGKIQDAAEVFHCYLKYHRTGGEMSFLGCEIKA